MKQRHASAGVHTMGSPSTLKLVLTSTGQPVRALNASSRAWKRGLVSRCTVCTRAEWSTWVTAGISERGTASRSAGERVRPAGSGAARRRSGFTSTTNSM